MKIIKYILIYLLILSSLELTAQNFAWESEVPAVEESGFYKIFLAPQITSKLRRHYPDVRIINKKGEEIPFLYDTDKLMASPDSTEPLNIIKNKHRILKAHTTVIIRNDSLHPISNFAFTVDNTGMRKWLKIRAGNNQKDWYVLKDNFPAQSAYSDSARTELLLSNIPSSNFKYYEITFYDHDNEAVKVHRAYTYRSSLAQQNYIPLPEFRILHTDTLGRTIVKLEFEEAQYIDRLLLTISGPKFYFRNAVLEKPGEAMERDGVQYYDELTKNLRLSSDKENVINLSHYRARIVKLTIDNRDNQSLRISQAKAYQQKSYIIAYLNANEKYSLRFGHPTLDFPVYDLEYFKEQIPQNIETLHIREIVRKKADTKKMFASKIWNLPVGYLWIGMGVLSLSLLYLTFKMIWKQYRK